MRTIVTICRSDSRENRFDMFNTCFDFNLDMYLEIKAHPEVKGHQIEGLPEWPPNSPDIPGR